MSNPLRPYVVRYLRTYNRFTPPKKRWRERTLIRAVHHSQLETLAQTARR
jgi:hypothetical protein